MNWEAIGAIAEAVGAAGVIASLVYLGTQIRSNTRAAKATAYQQTLTGGRDINLAGIANSGLFETRYAPVLNGNRQSPHLPESCRQPAARITRQRGPLQLEALIPR